MFVRMGASSGSLPEAEDRGFAGQRRVGRRRTERRSDADAASANMRKAERRGAPPFTWDTADFVVVEEPAVPVGSDKSSK